MYIFKNVIAIKVKKTKVKINKPVYFGLSIQDISKTLIYKFWYDYNKSKYQNNAALCYMVKYSFIIHIKTKDFYEDIVNDVEKILDTQNCEVDRLLPIEKN